MIKLFSVILLLILIPFEIFLNIFQTFISFFRITTYMFGGKTFWDASILETKNKIDAMNKSIEIFEKYKGKDK